MQGTLSPSRLWVNLHMAEQPSAELHAGVDNCVLDSVTVMVEIPANSECLFSVVRIN